MKSTGIVRKVDELGRIVIPMELRRTFNIEVKDPLEIYVDENRIILSKFEQACVFCGGTDNMSLFRDKHVCWSCRSQIADTQ